MDLVDIKAELRKIAEFLISTGVTRDEALKTFDRMYLIAGLKFTDGNATKAAKVMGISYNRLLRHLPNRREAYMQALIEETEETKLRYHNLLKG